jgi:hypothetical protein
MSKTLSVQRVVKVVINLSPKAAGRRNFGVLAIAGPSAVIDQSERIREYTGISAVAADFGVDAPEYAAAEIYFSQTPRPSILHIARWLKAAAPAILRGAALTDAEAALAEWTDIDAGSLTVTVGGVETTVDALDFSDAITLEGVAGIVSAALAAHGASCTFDGTRFILSTTATGAAATIGYAEGALAAQMKLTAETGLAPVPGADAETPLECATALADRSGEWYGLVFADTGITVDQHLAVASYINASDRSRIYGATIIDTRAMDKTYTQDLASRAKAAGIKRILTAYSANPYAVVSAFGRAFTVNFDANRSTITLKFKQLPGITAENLGETQALALAGKNCNVFAAYDNDTAIFQEGVMADGTWFDEVHGTDWLQNAVQTEVWNLFYQGKTKVPQTDGGVNRVVARIETVLSGAATDNGLIAPGTWNSDGFGQLEDGDYLPKGYYIYAGLVDDQAQSDREQRVAPPIQVAVKLAGAIHSVDVQIDVNR